MFLPPSEDDGIREMIYEKEEIVDFRSFCFVRSLENSGRNDSPRGYGLSLGDYHVFVSERSGGKLVTVEIADYEGKRSRPCFTAY